MTRNTWGRLRLSGLLSASLSLMLVLTGCGGSGPAAEPDAGDFYVLALLGTSGLVAPSAAPLLEGAKAAVAVINEAGGIKGEKVTLKVVDTQSDPSRAVSKLQAEIATRRPDLIYAGSSSAEVVALLPAVTRERIPLVTNTVADEVGDGRSFPYVFSSLAGRKTQAQFFVDLLADKGHRKVGVFAPNNAFGTSNAEGYVAAFKEAGLEVHSELFEQEDLDMSSPLARLRGRGVEAVVFLSTGPAGGYVIKSRAKIGMDVPFYGDTAVATANVFSLITPEEAAGVELNTWAVNLDLPEAEQTEGKRKLVAALAAANYTYTTALGTNAMAYDAIMLAANAFERIDGGDADAWKQAMIAGDGDKFAISISTENARYTEDDHFRKDMGGYTLLPAATPLENGIFQFAP